MGIQDNYPNASPYFALNPGIGTVTPFEFWGSPIIKSKDGTLSCPGYTGDTFSKRHFDMVKIEIPFPSQVNWPYDIPGTPGTCEVIVDKKRDIDKKKPKGQDGARLTLHGVEPGLVDIRITIWTPEQFRALQILWRVLQPQAGKGTPYPFAMTHPTLVLHGVTAVQIVSAEGLSIGSFPNSRIFTIKGIEYLPPMKGNATTTPNSVKTNFERGSALDIQLPGTNPANTGPF